MSPMQIQCLSTVTAHLAWSSDLLQDSSSIVKFATFSTFNKTINMPSKTINMPSNCHSDNPTVYMYHSPYKSSVI